MSKHLQGVLLLVLVTALWGSTFAMVKQLGQNDLPASVLVAWRFLIASVAMLPLLLIKSKQTYPESSARSLWRDGFILGAWLAAGYSTQTIALQTIGANRAAFITALSVILVPVWLAFVQGRRLSLNIWLALPLAIGGLGLLSWEGGHLGVGDLWALACALTYVGFIVSLEKMASRHPALPFTFTQLITVTGFGWIWALLSEPNNLWPESHHLPALLFLGVLATALTTVMQTVGQRWVNAAQASVIYSLEPVTATMFSYLLINERIYEKGLLGGLMMVTALILSSWSNDQNSDHHTSVPDSQK